MDAKKLFGGILILVGIALAFYGINELNSMSSKLLRLAGQTNTGAYLSIGGGIVVGVVGVMMMFSKRD